MSIETIRNLIADLTTSAGALAALGGELDSRLSGKPLHPNVRPHVDAILEGLGATSALEGVTPEELRSLIGQIRSTWPFHNEFLRHPEITPGWTCTDPEVLETFGEGSEVFADVLRRIAPQFDGLAERLSGPNGRFLDVGTGVGRFAIAMARSWPLLQVVGIDPWAPALARARANVAAAGIEDRIELREQAGEEIPDEQAFDLAWLAAPCIPPHVLWPIVECVHRALRPGGWFLFGTFKPHTDLRGAVMRFTVATWGGQLASQEEIEKQLDGLGFTQTRILPGPPFALVVAARRAPST
jgi:SAM-dependent methyltransferase